MLDASRHLQEQKAGNAVSAAMAGRWIVQL